jgi:hypothetical protein
MLTQIIHPKNCCFLDLQKSNQQRLNPIVISQLRAIEAIKSGF